MVVDASLAGTPVRERGSLLVVESWWQAGRSPSQSMPIESVGYGRHLLPKTRPGGTPNPGMVTVPVVEASRHIGGVCVLPPLEEGANDSQWVGSILQRVDSRSLPRKPHQKWAPRKIHQLGPSVSEADTSETCPNWYNEPTSQEYLAIRHYSTYWFPKNKISTKGLGICPSAIRRMTPQHSSESIGVYVPVLTMSRVTVALLVG